MRAGSAAVQQSLTAEVTAILKLSLSVARRRGHAQVTPLHVAGTLLSSSSLLRGACLRSHPLPLHCRALELCFNVALNRLPTSPSPSHPSLSNALIAALKRAQAHQRRGCIESQTHHSQPPLPLKVDLDQLLISILDDPSVSRVMKEAGFSSASVKQNLEHDASAKPHQSFLFNAFLPSQLLKKEEDVRVVFEVMLRRNAVVVGDSAFMAEEVVAEVLLKLERGEVPEEFRGAQVLKVQPFVSLMSRADLDKRVSDLRRKVFSLLEKGVVVYAGDLRWAVDEGDADVEYVISEIGRLLSQLRNGVNGAGGERPRVWVLASSSFQTYLKCKMTNPGLESQWELQVVVVPSGGLSLSLLHAPSGMDSMMSKLKHYQLQKLEPRVSNADEEDGNLLCCIECVSNYEKEIASVLKSEATGNTQLPPWLQNHRPDKELHKTNLLELRRKWKRLCQNLHQSRAGHAQAILPPFSSKAEYWWSNSLPPALNSIEPSSTSFSAHNRESLKPIMTTLALSGPLFGESATSADPKKAYTISPTDLTRKLQVNIPWQSQHIHLVVEALLNDRSREKRGTWMIVQGNDRIAKWRLARVVAESLFGSTERILHINVRNSAGKAIDLIKEAIGKESKAVVLIECFDCPNPDFLELIREEFKVGVLKDSNKRQIDLANFIFILTSYASNDAVMMEENCRKVLRMRMRTEVGEDRESVSNDKRKIECISSTVMKKKPRNVKGGELDLNVAFPGDNDGEADSGFVDRDRVRFPEASVVHLDISADSVSQIIESFRTRLQRAFEEEIGRNGGEGRLVLDLAVAEELAAASGFFLEFEFDSWVRQVFQNCIPTVRKGGKVRLGMEGKGGNTVELGFLSSVLPKKIFVD